MKKNSKKRDFPRIDDKKEQLARLKRWKYASTKAKLDWLAAAWKLGKFRKF